ncbi:MAG: phage terminase small subunit P27 family [Chloroflexi bacterium]|nr:phage terminase small subunit P27 family [Chloroflexota bacterium]
MSGSRGPASTPTAKLKARGSRRAKARNDPEVNMDKPKCPPWVGSYGKTLWRELVPQLHNAGILSKVDGGAFARYCYTYHLYRTDMKWLKDKGSLDYTARDKDGRVTGVVQFPAVARVQRHHDQMLKMEREFGLTPSARAGLGGIQQDKPKQVDNTLKFVNAGRR